MTKIVEAKESPSKGSTSVDSVSTGKFAALPTDKGDLISAAALAVSTSEVQSVAASAISRVSKQPAASVASKPPATAVSRDILLKNLEAAWDLVSSLDASGIFAAPVYF